MPGDITHLRIRSGAVIDGIQIVSPNFQGTYHGGDGGQEFMWDCRHGITKIVVSYGGFKGNVVITGLQFCDGAGKWS